MRTVGEELVTRNVHVIKLQNEGISAETVFGDSSMFPVATSLVCMLKCSFARSEARNPRLTLLSCYHAHVSDMNILMPG